MNTASVPQSSAILQTIGQTPLVHCRRYLDVDDVKLFVKLESFNPAGSAKDRPALAMIQDGLRSGLIGPETTIVESSSGNMGVGLAMVCQAYGLKFHCVVDPRAQKQNLAIMRALGATVECVETPLRGDYLAARLARVCEIVEQDEYVYWPNQYSNKANPASHAVGAIAEIGESLKNQFDTVFVATSSTGTLLGCQEYLRQNAPDATLIAVDAFGSVLFGGERGTRKIPGLGTGRTPALAATADPSRVVRASDWDCVVGCRRAAMREAFLPGGSGGGVLEAVRSMQDALHGQVVVAILHDSGTRYLQSIYDDDWVRREFGSDLLESVTEPSLPVTASGVA